MVEVTGEGKTEPQKMSLSVYAEKHVEVIPSILASIAAQKVLNADINHQGIVPLHNWLSKEQFIAELSKRLIKLGIKEHGSQGWSFYSEQGGV